MRLSVLFTFLCLFVAQAQAASRVIVVASDGSGDFTEVQQAVDQVPENNNQRVVIQIKPGVYREQIRVGPGKRQVTFRGDDPFKTILTFKVSAQQAGSTRLAFSTFVNADDFRAESLTFENTFGTGSQAVALFVDADGASFRNCRFLGWQDTLFVNGGRHFFKDCYIEGHVDSEAKLFSRHRFFSLAARGTSNRQEIGTIAWKDAHEKADEWYASAEALRIADNVVLYQRSSGGWPKNLDMGKPLYERDRAVIKGQKNDNDSTIDNGATFTQLSFLARVYKAQHHERHRESFLRGLDFLLQAQYPNGGWPQFYPKPTGYQKRITFNDGAMIGAMKLLRDVAAAKTQYAFVDEARRAKAASAVERGIECILKTQVIVDGRRTVWSAQHDEATFAPAPARTFELASLSGGESVEIVRFLMSIKEPAPDVVDAVESAVKWFEQAELKGIKWVKKKDASKPGGIDCVVIKDPESSVWARFYEIGSNRPIFAGRDGVVKYNVAQIEHERRTNYEWYVDDAAKLLKKDYPAWRKSL